MVWKVPRSKSASFGWLENSLCSPSNNWVSDSLQSWWRFRCQSWWRFRWWRERRWHWNSGTLTSAAPKANLTNHTFSITLHSHEILIPSVVELTKSSTDGVKISNRVAQWTNPFEIDAHLVGCVDFKWHHGSWVHLLSLSLKKISLTIYVHVRHVSWPRF